MNAIPFDTLKMARKLEAAGFPAPQAAGAVEAMAEAMSGAELATKADLLEVKNELKSDVQAVKTELQEEIRLLRTDLEREIGLVRPDLEREIGLVRTDVEREICLVRTDLAREVGLLRTDLTREIGHARSDMTAMETRQTSALEILRRDMTIRLGGLVIASTGIMLAAMRFMLAHP
jgi:hypothetical protein